MYSISSVSIETSIYFDLRKLQHLSWLLLFIMILKKIYINLDKTKLIKLLLTKLIKDFINRLDEDWVKRGCELKLLLAYCVNKMNE